jgi:hypothetical protein
VGGAQLVQRFGDDFLANVDNEYRVGTFSVVELGVCAVCEYFVLGSGRGFADFVLTAEGPA